MQVNGVNGANTSAPQVSAQPVDEVSKNIQNQIANAQMQLQKLSSDREMSTEEKQQKRQELQKQISELNTQLRQHQMEVRREQQAKAKSSQDDLSPGGKTEQQQEEKIQTALSTNSMKAIISAESAMTEAESHGNVVSSLEGRVRVLQGEIKQDAKNGNNTERKQKELEQLENRVTRVSGARMGVLSDAVQDMRQTAKQERSAQDDQKVKQGTEDKTVVAEKLNLAAGVEAYNKGKFFSNVNIQM